MKKKLLSMFLAVCMVVSLLPTVSVPAFAADTYDIALNPSYENGTVSVNPESAAAGAMVTVTATPYSGYALKSLQYMTAASIEEDGTEIPPEQVSFIGNGIGNNQYTFTMPDQQITILAYFETGYTVTISGTTGGTVTASSTTNVVGAEVKLTVEPAEGYELDTLTVTDANNNEVTVYSENTFTMPANDVTVVPTFKVKETSITIQTVSGTGIKILEGTTEVASWEADAEAHEVTGLKFGSSYTVNVTVPEGYEEFSSTTLAIGTDGSISFGGATLSEGVYQLNLTAKKYQVMSEPVQNGIVGGFYGNEYAYGTTVTVNITPNAGYKLNHISADPSVSFTKLEENKYTFTMPAFDVTLSGSFTAIDYTVTLSGDTGYITNSSDFPMAAAHYGDTITLTVADVPFGYKLSFEVKDADGKAVSVTAPADGSVNGEYSFSMPASNVTITATYGIDTGFVCVDEDQALYKNGDDYYQLDDTTDTFTPVHVHEENGAYIVFQLWDGASHIGTGGSYALSADAEISDGNIVIGNTSTDEVFNLCLNGHVYNISRYLHIVSDTTISDCSSNNTGYIRTLMVENAAVTLNGITVNGLSNFGNQGTSAVTVNGGSIDSIANLEASGSTTLNLDGNLVIKGTDSEPGIYVGPNTKIYLDENFAGTNGKTGEGVDTRITVGEAVNGDDLTFGETWTFITSGATETNKTMFVYDKTVEELNDGVTTEIQTVLDEATGTLSFKAVHKHDDGTEYVGWDGTDDIKTEGNYVLTGNIEEYTGIARSATDEIIDVTLCLNGHTVSKTLRCQYADLTVYDCSTEKAGTIENLWVSGADDACVTLQDVKVPVLGNFGGTVNVYDGEFQGIGLVNTSSRTATLNLYGAPVITGDGTYPGIEAGVGATIHLDESFAGTNGKTGEGVDTRITVDINQGVLEFGTPWTFITSGGTEANKDLFVYHKTAEELDDDVTTEIQTIHEGGKLYFKAVHKHADGTIFDKALDATVNSSISEAGNYVVTVENPMDDSDEQVSLIYARADVILCLNGKDCSGSAVMIVDDKTVEIYDHADGDGNYKGNLEAIIAYSGNLIINGGNYGGIQGNDGSITFNSGTVSDFVSAYPSTEDVTINVNGGIICRITGREENSSDLTINLNGSPVITGNGSYTAGDFNSTAHILLGSGVVLDIVDGFNGSGENGEKITVQFYNYVNSAYVTHDISVDNDDIVFAKGDDLSKYVDTFAYYDSDRNVTVVLSADKTELSFHLETITVDNGDGTTTKVEAIDKDNDGIYEDKEGYEVYIPTPEDNDPNYIKVEKDPADYTKDETTGVYNDNDGVFEDEEGNRYIPVDTDDPADGKADDSLVDTADPETGKGDGIFEDDQGKTYVPDGDDEDKLPDEVIDNGNGTYTDPGKDGVEGTDDDVNYIPDQDGDGEAEKDDNNDGIYEGTKDENDDGKPDNIYVPDGDDDDTDPDKVIDNGNGTYTDPGKDGEVGTDDDVNYIPDQDGDKLPEKDDNNDGIYEGTEDENDDGKPDNIYVPDGDDADTDPDKVIDNGNGTYTDPGEDGEEGTDDDVNYIPDQDGDKLPEKEKEDEPGIFEGTKDETEYIPDADGDGEAETDDDGDGIFEGSEDGENYIPDQDGDDIPEKEKEDEPGIFEGSDEEKDKDYVVDPDKEPPYVEVEKDEDSGVYEPVDPEDEDKYIPDQDGDDYAEKDEDDDGIFEGTDEDKNKDYISNGNGGFVEYIPYYPVIGPVKPVHDCPSKVFSDVNTELWYHEAIDYVITEGLMGSVGGSAFAPLNDFTRAQMWVILARLDGVDTNGGATWYEKGMNWAMTAGISDGTNPDAKITREQLVTMLYRYAQYKGMDVSARVDLSGFADGGATSSWAKDAMEWAVNARVIGGKGNGSDRLALDPTGTATRAEVAQIFMNYCTKILKK